MATEPTHPYEILDVFTDTPLEGNQLAVFTQGTAIDPALMQRTARELNLSETVFVLPCDDGDAEADVRVRIFTPAAELPFAGHPVLGTAFALARRLGGDAVRLRTGAGVVPVALRRENGEIVFGEMEQPIPAVAPFEPVAALLAALGLERSELPVEVYDNGPHHVYVVLGDEAAVTALRPNLGALDALGAIGVSCLALTPAGVHSRMFAPGLGVAEDPATGSAAGPLALHLARHGRIAWGEPVVIRQGAEIRRPSVLHARVDGSERAIDRIVVGGKAVLVACGAYRLT
jgi:trans-2,3-dihydro-3-hydroxyanthranilate isomerase